MHVTLIHNTDSAKILYTVSIYNLNPNEKKKKSCRQWKHIEMVLIIYAHLKPLGAVFPQLLSNKLSERAALRWAPKTLALMAVQRQTAASTSARFSIREQHELFDDNNGLPTTTCTKSFNKLAHTFSLSVFFGHLW